MKDYLGYIAAKFISFILCLLPLRLGLFLGRRLGGLAFFINKKRRIVAYVNLKAAFCKEKSPCELKKITKGAYKNFGQMLVELLRFPVINKRYVEKFISVSGLERIKESMAKEKGTVILTGHFGNWELLSLIGGFMNFPISVLAREQKHSRLNDLLNSYRQMTGCRVIKKGITTRQLIKALEANEMIGILTDQDAGRHGVLVNFFGRPASTHSGAFIFAQRTGAQIIPAFISRHKGPYHKIEVLKPIELPGGKGSYEDMARAIQQFSNALESYVRAYPMQWLWVHKRWKSTPKRSIVILNDQKAGHLNQSLAVAEIIKKYRRDKGFKPEDTVCRVINVTYKNKFLWPGLAACSNFSSLACQGCMGCLKFCLKGESYKELMGVHADIVISCGSSLAPVNVFMAKENNARNIIIMKPNLVNISKFKLAIVPRHDRPKRRKNMLVTVGCPSRINEAYINEEAGKLAPSLNLSGRAVLAVFLGGDNPDYEMDVPTIKEVISQIKSASQKLDLEILVTTSRRTPKAVEDLLKAQLGGFKQCRLLVIANEKNIDGAVPAMLGLSKAALVSGETITRISEAAASGRYALVFPLKKKNDKRTRHDMMVEDLNKAGFIKFIGVDKIGNSIEEALRLGSPAKRLDNYEKIYNAVGGLI